MLSKVRQSELFRAAVDFLYPPLCLGCDEYTENSFQICPKCIRHLEEFSSPFCLACKHILPDSVPCPVCGEDSCYVYSLAHYSSPVVDIIMQYKFKGITAPSLLFAEKILEQFGEQLSKLPNCILHPIPLHHEREKLRGYNQAALLAQAVAEKLAVPYRDDILYRVKKRKAQSKMSLSDRKRNIQGVFHIDTDITFQTVPGIILVDDVLTSGCTIKEAKFHLEQVGYTVPAVITIAQAF